MSVRVLVTGAKGMLGSDLRRAAPSGVDLTGVDIDELDVRDGPACRALLQAVRPQHVIHCAAFTDVDQCTRHPEPCLDINATGTRRVAEATAELGARLVYMSSDYVFDGHKREPYVETDAAHPLNPYGDSKLQGEQHVRELTPNHLIIRTQWLFGTHGRNFVSTIVGAAREGRELRVITDQRGAPTYTRDLAGAIWAALDLPSGTYHVTNGGVATWYGVAWCALDAADLHDVRPTPIRADEWDSPTVRPAYAVLSNAKWVGAGMAPLRPWQEAVTEFVKETLVPQAGHSHGPPNRS